MRLIACIVPTCLNPVAADLQRQADDNAAANFPFPCALIGGILVRTQAFGNDPRIPAMLGFDGY